MKHHLHLLLAAGFGAISIGAAAAVHDWTATRIGIDADAIFLVDMNNAGQVALGSLSGGGRGTTQRAFLYTPGSSGGLVDLGSFGGPQTRPTALNASGQVVGWSTFPQDPIVPPPPPTLQAFIYQNGRMERLASPGGEFAVDINDRGQVVTSDGTIFHPAAPTVLRSPSGGAVGAHGINNRGQVFGGWHSPTGAPSSFFYDNGRTVDIGTLGGNTNAITNAIDMNNSGQIVGASDAADGRPRPFLYSDGRMTEIGATNYGSAVDINDRGQVLVLHRPEQFSPHQDAFLYSDGQMREVGDLGGDAASPERINNLGQVVGFSAVAGGDFHAYFYSDDDGRTTDLTRWLMTSFGDVARLRAGLELNDLGQIAIGATLTNGQHTLFVLTPIPEPSTYALMLSGLGVLAWIARRQRGRSTGNRADQTPQTGLAA